MRSDFGIISVQLIFFSSIISFQLSANQFLWFPRMTRGAATNHVGNVLSAEQRRIHSALHQAQRDWRVIDNALGRLPAGSPDSTPITIGRGQNAVTKSKAEWTAQRDGLSSRISEYRRQLEANRGALAHNHHACSSLGGSCNGYDDRAMKIAVGLAIGAGVGGAIAVAATAGNVGGTDAKKVARERKMWDEKVERERRAQEEESQRRIQAQMVSQAELREAAESAKRRRELEMLARIRSTSVTQK